MSYMQEMDQWLENILTDLPLEKRAEIKHDIKNALLTSFRSGQSASKSGAERSRDQWRGKGATRP